MSKPLTEDASFSSRQELLNLNEASTSPNALENPASSELDSNVPNSGKSDQKILCTYENSTPLQFVPQTSEDLCGWHVFKPRCLQVFNTPKGILFFLCSASFLQGMIVNGLINTVITSIERRFDLRSYHSGMIASSYDIAACICLTFVSYFGGYGHKPRWLGWGVLIMGLGSLVFTLPHFTSGHYELNLSDQTDLCFLNQTGKCDKVTSGMSNYRFVFMVGQFLHGVGATPLYTLGVTYLDENVKLTYAPVYIGIFYTAAILGPAAGYLLGGYFLQFYEDINTKISLTPESPLWVGAWWIGFLGTGVVSFLVAIPILGYPRQLPGSQRYLAMRVSEAHQLKDGSHMTALDPNFGTTVKDLPRSALLLLKNPTFIFLCFSGATEATLIAGMSTFGPKFLESQFSLSAAQAATIFGFLVVPAGGGGTFLGGFIINKLKLRCAGIIRFCLICTTLGLLAIFIVYIHCPNMPVAGITSTYNGSFYDGAVKLTTSCNAECKCSMEIYNPICGDDNLMYYSPCHAGCTKFNTSQSESNTKIFYNCSCIMDNLETSLGSAKSGKCTSTCKHKTLFLSIFFLVIFFTFLGSIPAVTATLRCVPESQKSFALGIQWIVVRTLGGIPGPIAFGSIIDISCLLWQDQCGERGSCYVYQNSDMSKYLLIAGVTYKILGSVFFFTAWLLYKPPSSSINSSNNEESIDLRRKF